MFLGMAATIGPSILHAQEIKRCPCGDTDKTLPGVKTNKIDQVIKADDLSRSLSQISVAQLGRLRFFGLKEVPDANVRNFRLRVIPEDTIAYNLGRGANLIVNPCQHNKDLLVSVDTRRRIAPRPGADSSFLALRAWKSAARQTEISYRDLLIRLAHLQGGASEMRPFFDRLNEQYKLNLSYKGRRINADTLANRIYRRGVPFYDEIYKEYLARFAGKGDSVTAQFQQAVSSLLNSGNHSAFASFSARRRFLNTMVLARASFEYADFSFPVLRATEGGNGSSLLRARLDEVRWAAGYGLYYEAPTFICVPEGTYIGPTGASFTGGRAYLDLSERLTELNNLPLHDVWPGGERGSAPPMDSFTGILFPQSSIQIPGLQVNKGNVTAYNFLIDGRSASFVFALPVNHVRGKRIHLQNGFKEYKTTAEELRRKFSKMGFTTVKVMTDEPYDESRAKYVRIYLRYEM